jgi:CelD/BcsL family acetyltransferase involved in cellulose biosynthesis
VTVGVATDPTALHALAGEWAGLWARSPQATPFQHPGWLLAWWEAFGTALPVVAWSRNASGLTGLLPLYVLEDAGGSRLLPVGAGLTDYQDVLLSPGQDAAPLLDAALAASGTHQADLFGLPPWSPLRHVAPVPGWAGGTQDTEACPVLALGDGFTACVPPRQRRKLRMSRHRADRLGGWTTLDATPDTLDSALDSLFALHQARWTAQGEPGVLADPLVGRFVRQAARTLLPLGLLRVVTTTLAGKVAAACLLLQDHQRLYFWMSGFDAAFAQESPGTLLLGDLLEGETREAHFLRGTESYKLAWGAVPVWNAGLFLSSRPEAAPLRPAGNRLAG